MTPMTPDPLQTLFNKDVKEPNLSLRKAMLERLRKLGISNDDVVANLIRNAVIPIETRLYLAPMSTPPENPRELLISLHDTYAAKKTEKPADFPPPALAYYEDAILKRDLNRTPFTAPDGVPFTPFDIEYALMADLRTHGCAAALDQLPQTPPPDPRAPGRPSRVPARSL